MISIVFSVQAVFVYLAALSAVYAQQNNPFLDAFPIDGSVLFGESHIRNGRAIASCKILRNNDPKRQSLRFVHALTDWQNVTGANEASARVNLLAVGISDKLNRTATRVKYSIGRGQTELFSFAHMIDRPTNHSRLEFSGVFNWMNSLTESFAIKTAFDFPDILRDENGILPEVSFGKYYLEVMVKDLSDPKGKSCFRIEDAFSIDPVMVPAQISSVPPFESYYFLAVNNGTENYPFQSYDAVYVDISMNNYNVFFANGTFWQDGPNSTHANSSDYEVTAKLFKVADFSLPSNIGANRIHTLNYTNDGCGFFQPIDVTMKLLSPTLARFFMPRCAGGVWNLSYVFPDGMHGLNLSFHAVENSATVEDIMEIKRIVSPTPYYGRNLTEQAASFLEGFLNMVSYQFKYFSNDQETYTYFLKNSTEMLRYHDYLLDEAIRFVDNHLSTAQISEALSLALTHQVLSFEMHPMKHFYNNVPYAQSPINTFDTSPVDMSFEAMINRLKASGSKVPESELPESEAVVVKENLKAAHSFKYMSTATAPITPKTDKVAAKALISNPQLCDFSSSAWAAYSAERVHNQYKESMDRSIYLRTQLIQAQADPFASNEERAFLSVQLYASVLITTIRLKFIRDVIEGLLSNYPSDCYMVCEAVRELNLYVNAPCGTGVSFSYEDEIQQLNVHPSSCFSQRFPFTSSAILKSISYESGFPDAILYSTPGMYADKVGLWNFLGRVWDLQGYKPRDSILINIGQSYYAYSNDHICQFVNGQFVCDCTKLSPSDQSIVASNGLFFPVQFSFTFSNIYFTRRFYAYLYNN